MGRKVCVNLGPALISDPIRRGIWNSGAVKRSAWRARQYSDVSSSCPGARGPRSTKSGMKFLIRKPRDETGRDGNLELSQTKFLDIGMLEGARREYCEFCRWQTGVRGLSGCVSEDTKCRRRRQARKGHYLFISTRDKYKDRPKKRSSLSSEVWAVRVHCCKGGLRKAWQNSPLSKVSISSMRFERTPSVVSPQQSHTLACLCRREL